MRIRIEEMLDSCISELRAGKTISEVLKAYPEAADELRPLLEISETLQNLPDPSTSTVELIRRIRGLSARQIEEDEANSRARGVRLFSFPVWSRAAAIILVVFLAGWTTVTASAQALPGSFLYPVKLFTERVKFFLTVNREDKAELRIVFSEERLRELVKKQQQGGGIDKKLLVAMLEEARLAVESSPKLSVVSRGLLISRMAYLSEFQEKTLEHLTNRVSPVEKKELMPFMDMCRRRCAWMREMMCGAGAESGSGAPDAKLMRTWMRRCPMRRGNR